MKKSTIILVLALCFNYSVFAQKQVVVHDEQANIFTKIEYDETTSVKQFKSNFHFSSGLPYGAIDRFTHKERELFSITSDELTLYTWNIPDKDTIKVVYNPNNMYFPFISEYVKGSGRNKALEIFNPDILPISLSNKNYKVEIYSNGSSNVTRSIVLEHPALIVNIIDTESTFILTEPRANEDILNLAHQTSGNMDMITGDDAIVLRYGDLALDIFGVIGEQPTGDGWGPNNETKDHTLRRKPHITSGVKSNPESFDPYDEWLIFEKDNIDDLGKHEIIITGFSNEHTKNQTIELHPNPASDRIMISTTEEIKTCQLIDMSGISYPCRLNHNEINISTLTSGVYQLIINTEKGYSSQRLTKN